MTSARFHYMEAYFNNFRGTKCTQLACNEDGVIDKRSISICKAYIAHYNFVKNMFKKFDDSCEKGNKTVMQIHERSIFLYCCVGTCFLTSLCPAFLESHLLYLTRILLKDQSKDVLSKQCNRKCAMPISCEPNLVCTF